MLLAAPPPPPPQLLYNPTRKALRADKFRAFKLIKKEQISHDTIRVTFENPDGPKAILGLPIGQHISFKFKNAEGKEVIRSYTPTTGDEKPGIVTFVMKVYKPNPPKFPDGGQMSQYVDSLKVGDSCLFRGPKGHLDYQGCGKFEIHRARKPVDKRTCTHIGMIAGGTGLTPMLQVIQAVLRNPKDHTKMYLLLANQTEEDILCREEVRMKEERSRGRRSEQPKSFEVDIRNILGTSERSQRHDSHTSYYSSIVNRRSWSAMLASTLVGSRFSTPSTSPRPRAGKASRGSSTRK